MRKKGQKLEMFANFGVWMTVFSSTNTHQK